jgi:hypothetical protein
MQKLLVLSFLAVILVGCDGAVPVRILDEPRPTARVTNVTNAEYNALVALFASTNGPSWKNNTNWLQSSTSPCTWFGVNCAPTGNHVIAIGTLPCNSVRFSHTDTHTWSFQS